MTSILDEITIEEIKNDLFTEIERITMLRDICEVISNNEVSEIDDFNQFTYEKLESITEKLRKINTKIIGYEIQEHKKETNP
jgi:phosphopantetheine adenylyltransferase